MFRIDLFRITVSRTTMFRAALARSPIASSLLVAASLLFAGAAPQLAAQTPPANTAPTQNSSTAASQTFAPASTDTAATPAKKPKKVWTNENMADATGPISVVGDGRTSKTKSTPPTPADPTYVAKTKKDLQKLQEQIDDADKQLAKLKDFNEGEPVGSGAQEFHKGYNSQPISQQITGLETKKKDLQSKIDALLDEARKKGVEPGQLR